MCGISGIISSAPLTADDVASLSTVNTALYHRGPDSEGRFQDSCVAMAMRRLSIIDLSSGNQPLFNEDRSLAIVCNGEIYNHHELRSELQGRGHVFRTSSDVETIVHLYEELGERCVDRLFGMFAFALWDARAGKLLLARDRLGEKPLYLYRENCGDGRRRLWWSSELTALTDIIPANRRQLSPLSLHEFFTFQYCLEPHAPVKDVTQLPAGHILVLRPSELDSLPTRYWNMLRPVGELKSGDPVSMVQTWFDTACRRMGSADVPVGVSLSGGIDSSLVAAIMARHYRGQIHGFTVGYKGRPQIDEREIAKRFARSLDIPLTEVEIDPDEMVEEFPDLVAAMDTPVADIAAYGYYAVCRAARTANVPVLLSGMGGDEMFWGYEWVREAARHHQLQARGQYSLWDRVRRIKGGVRGTPQDPSIFAPHQSIAHAAALSRSLFCNRETIDPNHWLAATRPDQKAPSGPAITEALSRTWLLSNCLTLLDRMSMAHSIELRVPFLDIELVNGVSILRRNNFDDFNKPHKWLLLQAYGELLPDEIKNRPKQGFTPPTVLWMQKIIERWSHLWRDGGILVESGLLDLAAVEASQPAMSNEFRYRLTIAELWARRILDAPRMTMVRPGESSAQMSS